MRIVAALAAVLAAAAAISAAGCESTPKHVGDRSAMVEGGPIETPTATLTVHGMGCPLCANNVDKQLLAIEGVRGVHIDMGTGRVRVQLAEENRPSRAQLARAIDESGFTLVGIETP
jgi:copper chaperone